MLKLFLVTILMPLKFLYASEGKDTTYLVIPTTNSITLIQFFVQIAKNMNHNFKYDLKVQMRHYINVPLNPKKISKNSNNFQNQNTKLDIVYLKKPLLMVNQKCANLKWNQYLVRCMMKMVMQKDAVMEKINSCTIFHTMYVLM